LVQTIDLVAMKLEHVSKSIRPGWILPAAFVVLSGCAPFSGETPTGEPTMKPITGRAADPSQTGQQEASLQLTDEGRRLLASGQSDKAASVFQKAISLYPNNPYAYYYLAQSRYRKGELAQSLAPLRQAELYLSGDPTWLARVYALRGQIYEGQTQTEDARSQYQKALSLDFRNLDAREGMDRIQNLTAPPIENGSNGSEP
jgi:Flp pilus assembly protein TadD